jgi:hypothetical protein
MPRLIKLRSKILVLLVLVVVILAGWIYWNRPKKDDMAAYVPQDALAFVEVNDLDALASGISGTQAWQALATPLGAPSALLPHHRLIQLARWTGIGSAEALLAARSQLVFVISQPQASENNNALNIKPTAALVIETHTSQKRMRPILESQVARLAQSYYGQPTLSRKLLGDVELAEWSSADNSRHIILAFVDTVAIVGNDESLVLQCVDVRRGRRPSIAADSQLAQARASFATSDAQVFGFIPKAGVKPAVQAWALKRAGDSPNAGIAVQLISSTFGNMIESFAWTARFDRDGAEDRCVVTLAAGVAARLAKNMTWSPAPTDEFRFVPRDAASVTLYQFRNPDGFWKDFNGVVSSKSDALGAIAARPLLRGLLEPYGINDADAFFQAVGPKLQTIRLEENTPAVLIAQSFARTNLRRFAEQRTGMKLKAEVPSEPDMLSSKTDNWGVAFIDNFYLSGPSDSVQRCLAARNQGQSIVEVDSFKRALNKLDVSEPITTLTLSQDRQAAISFVEVFSRRERSAFSANAEEIQRASQGLPYAVNVTLMKGDGLEWSSRSSFGLLGSLFTTLRPEK